MSDIIDGTSNTLLMSERLCQARVSGTYRQTTPTAVALREVEFVLAVATRVGGIAASPINCYAAADGNYFAAGQPIQARFGTNWHDGQPMHVGFTTVFPPNAPACGDGGDNADTYTAILPPASRHPGGVNVVKADGSVDFVSNSINTGNLTVGQPRNGVSNYGVWGALGSKDGGDMAGR
jgi:prepilin-type processing-associated H-X9-DG protein